MNANRSARHVPDDETRLTPGELLRLIRKHLLLFLATWLAVEAAVGAWTMSQRKVYRAEVLLRLDPDPPKPLGAKVELVNGTNGDYWGRKEFYETEFRVMRSMRVALAVVKSHGLAADRDFLGVPPTVKLPVSPDDAAQRLIARLSVEPVRESSLAYLRYDDTDPRRSRTILDAVVATYLEQNLDTTTRVSTHALEWLNGQLDHLRTDLEKSEVDVNDYLKKNNVLSISLESGHNTIADQLDQVSKEITTLELKRDELEARNAELGAVGGGAADDLGSTEILQSVVISALRTTYAEQQRTLEELGATQGEEHPRYLAAKGKLDSTARAIQRETTNIKSALKRDLHAMVRQVGAAKAKKDVLNQQAHDLQALAMPFNQLARTKANNEKVYGLVLERVRETDLTRMLNFNNIRVIDESFEPKVPVKPNKTLNLGVGAIAGLTLALGVALLRELTDRSIKTPDDIEQQLGQSCLGLLPAIDESRRPYARRRRSNRPQPELPRNLRERDLTVAMKPDSGLAEAARALRTNLTFMSPDKPYRSLLVTSALPEEGKTTVACSLAIVLAQSGLKVLLVDTDLRRPRLHRTFAMSNDVGVSLVVSAQDSSEHSIRESGIPNLDVLTAGPVPPNPAEMVQSARFKAMLDDLLTRYDRVILDSPPVLPVTDAAILSQYVDGVVLVVRGYKTPRPASRQAINTLLDVRGPLVGVVLNSIDLSRHEYRQYYYYYRRDGYYRLDQPETESAPSSPSSLS